MAYDGEVANRSEASAGDDGIGNNVDVFVDLAGLKAAVEMNDAIAGVSLPSTVCANCHSERGMTVRVASRESRTVSTLRGSSGAATGYSVPPM